MTFHNKLQFDVLIRVIADVVIVNVTYLTAIVMRLLWKLAMRPGISGISPREQVFEGMRIYSETFWLLTLIAVVVYSISGFYSWGRLYRGRFKVLTIFQAVSLSYVLFGFSLYLSQAPGWFMLPPRSALLLAWFLTLGLTLGARLWATLWRAVVKREVPKIRGGLIPRQDEAIQHVLIIGGAGYIGSVLSRQLLDQGYTVRILDALMYGRESLGDLTDHPRCQLLEGDSRDVSAVFRSMLDMDAVIHLGELVGDPACSLDEKLTLEINLAATRMVAEAAQGCGIKRFVYASSCSVYGASTEMSDERSSLNPVSLYARAKIGSEQILLGLNGPDFHPVILRLATVYGLSPRPRFDLVVNLLAAKAAREGEITIFGGEQWRPFVHVVDVARAIVLCLQAPLFNVKARVFNVGSNEQNYTISQVGDLIQRIVPDAQVINHGEDKDKRDYHVSFSRIQRELSFCPSRSVEDGIREIEAALQNGGIRDYLDGKYSNYKTLMDPVNHLMIRSRHITKLYEPLSQPEASSPRLKKVVVPSG